MGRHYIDKYAQCPFYKGETEKKIYCEGVTDTTTIQLVFPGNAEAYKREHCHRTWENCLIAKALWSKYD